MKLVPQDDPVLLGKADLVSFPNSDLSRIVCQMLRFMVSNGGCGLAAPQVGIPLRIITYRHDGMMGAMINPEITHRNPEMIPSQEGCLSFPGEAYETRRHKDITISFTDLTGRRHEDKKVDGFMAVILQHECDHLEGIVLPQHGEKIVVATEEEAGYDMSRL